MKIIFQSQILCPAAREYNKERKPDGFLSFTRYAFAFFRLLRTTTYTIMHTVIT